jgi:hypothetical protein
MSNLAVPLLPSQIEAARRLYAKLELWQATNAAFMALRQAFPRFDLHASLLKAAAINQLYGTNVFAIVRMAQHISDVMRQRGDAPANLALVEEIARLDDPAEGGKTRRHLSFASKFAHFFIDKDRFPIYDSYAAMTLRYHLQGRAVAPTDPPPYARYDADIEVLQQHLGNSYSTSDLDAYLWLAGLYMEWSKPRAEGRQPEINREVRELFSRGAEVAADLAALVPMVSS